MREATTNGERRTVQRRYAPKTRTGCVTCKIRRVKCDEGKPACERCTSTGRRCDGYSQPVCLGSQKSVETPCYALSLDITTDTAERRTFDFFRSCTAPCVSGYFADPVWERLVLQISQSEPTVRYAVNALGALHEERSLHNPAGDRRCEGSQLKTRFPIVQYAKALQGLQLLLSAENVPLDLVIMSVLLMVHFEALRECFVPALVHIDNAIRLLLSSTTFDARKIDPSLVRCLLRLDVQGSLYLGMRVPGLPFFTAQTDGTLPTTFHDLTHARDIVNSWTCRLLHFMRVNADDHKFREPGNVPLEILAKSHDLTKTFMDLDKLLWDFMHKPTSRLNTREQHGLGMLRSRVKMDRILAATCLYSEATLYDAFIDDFEDILTICLYIMGSDDADKRMFSVSLDEGLLHPLYFIATHCRESRVRRQALAQLKKIPAREGIWHVEAMSRTAQICVNFEESACDVSSPSCKDIPEWRRIHSAGFDGWNLQSVKPKVTAHLRLRPNGMDGEWADISEIIEWNIDVPVEVTALYEEYEHANTHTMDFGNGKQRMITWP